MLCYSTPPRIVDVFQVPHAAFLDAAVGDPFVEEQAHWIRSFRHTLAEGVDGIAEYALIAEPGDRYAYSGAGYCVLGRVAELAAEQDFETILQERLCRPLGLSRTTFFPAGRFADHQISTGFGREAAPHRLAEDHRFPLIGGSLYSTAEEMTHFGQEVTAQWAGSDGRLHLKPQLIEELVRIRTPESGYSLGWKVVEREGQAPRISHSGALQSYRAWIGIDLETGVSVAGCWTLAKPAQQRPIPPLLQRVLESL
jgi:CubicO group peptidase (beta-lactamase class C family)